VDIAVGPRIIRCRGAAFDEETRCPALVVEGNRVGKGSAAHTGDAVQPVLQRAIERRDLGIAGILRRRRLFGGFFLDHGSAGRLRDRAVNRLWQRESRREQAVGLEAGLDLLQRFQAAQQQASSRQQQQRKRNLRRHQR